jgi:uncharacterized damage-inducible protein DinB
MDSVYVSGMFKNNTGLVTKAIADIPHEKWVATPGDGSNPLLWIVGHTIWARGNVVRTLGSSWSLDWAKQFARGTAREDASKYPSPAEVSQAWGDVSTELTALLPKATPELWEQPHNPPTFDGKVGGFIAFLAFHETYHVGQIGYLRKWLGYSGLVD